jgi:Flp pilus assembly protein TadG
MLSGLKKIFKEESGSAVVLAAVALIVVLSVSGLVIDLGQAYVEASNVQTAADSAALAAGMQLPVSLSDSCAIEQVQLTALEYVQKNGLDPSAVLSVELTDVYEGKYYGVKVNLVSNVPYYFGPIIGIDNAAVNKSAKSLLVPVTSTDAAVPLGIETGRLSTVITDCQGQHVTIKYGGGDSDGSFFGALDLDGVKGGGAKDFESWLAFGYGDDLTSGTVLPIEPGNMAGPTTSAFLVRFNQCTHFPGQGGCTVDHFQNDCPRVITIIAFTMVNSSSVKVEGFVPFVLESANGYGEVVASMVTMLTNEGQADGVLGGAGDYGIYKVRLAE